MSDVNLSSAAKQAFIALVVCVDKTSNPQLKERFGFVIGLSARNELEKYNLITSGKITGFGTAIFHELTEVGWNWVQSELAAGPGKSPTPPLRVLYGVLNALGAHMSTQGLKPADIFIPPSNSAPAVAPRPTKEAKRPGKADARSTEDRIVAAYELLARESGELVSLDRLRAKLDGVPRDEQDRALLALDDERRIHLDPYPHRAKLPQTAHKAAIRVGGEDKHMLSIESR